MISDDLKIADLIRKYLTAELLPAEREALDRWMESSPRHRELFDKLLGRRDLAQTAARQARFARYMDPEGAKRGASPVVPAGRRVRLAVRYAAVAAVAAVAMLLIAPRIEREKSAEAPIRHTYASAVLIRGEEEPILLSDTTTRLPEGLQIARGGEPRERTLSYRQARRTAQNRLVVPRGSDFRVELSDGTEVWLNAGSELEYPERFEGPRREVRLRGMAYFKVTRDARHPFVVETDRTRVRVLGTEFCVADCGGSSNLVTLVSGRVTVTDPAGGEHTLLPGQQSEVSAAGCTVREVETFYYTAWKDGYFIFHEAPLRRIMEELAGWYDLDYLIGDRSLDEVRITARIRKFDTAESVLELLSQTRKFRYRREGRLIRLLPPE